MTVKEKFIATGGIEISRHPDTSLRRLAVLENGMLWFPAQKQVFLKFKIYYLDEEGNLLKKSSILPYERELLADTSTKINSTTLEKISAPTLNAQATEEEVSDYNTALALYNSSPSEYDHFVDKAATENIFDLIINTVLYRDSVPGGKKFDV